MKNSLYYIVPAILFSFMFFPVCGYSGREVVRVVETEGTCVVSGGERAPARDSAIGDSMRRAVEQIVGILITEDVAAEKLDVLNKNIYSKSQDYIQDYRILQEDMEGGLYRVRVRATLLVEKIKDALERLSLLTGEWQPEGDATAVVGVVVGGIEKYSDFKTLREALEKNIRRVDAVHLRRMGSGVAVMDVDMQGNAFVLANELQLEQFRDFSLYVTDVTRDTIKLNVVKE